MKPVTGTGMAISEAERKIVVVDVGDGALTAERCEDVEVPPVKIETGRVCPLFEPLPRSSNAATAESDALDEGGPSPCVEMASPVVLAATDDVSVGLETEYDPKPVPN